MKFQVIGSGSKGNCTYVSAGNVNILIDAGISVKEINSRTDINLKEIDAIFITHEHIDHVKYIESIARLSDAVIYANEKTFNKMILKYFKSLDGIKVKYIDANKPFKLSDIKVMALNLQHDAENCYGYIFASKTQVLGYCTDTGYIPVPYIDILRKVNSLIIESNHDVEMLMESNRPWYLKQRILSVKGHMSNKICGELLNKILDDCKLEKIVLAHLSEECNTEEIAVDTVLENIEKENIPQIFVAKQWVALPLLEV